MTDKDDVTCCPKCGEPLGLEMVARFKAKSRVRIGLEPLEGELLGAGLIGDKIAALAGLLEKAGENVGVKTHVVVESMTTSETGRFEAVLLVLRDDRAKATESPSTERDGGEAKRSTPENRT